METVVPEKIQLTYEDDMWVAYDPESYRLYTRCSMVFLSSSSANIFWTQ